MKKKIVVIEFTKVDLPYGWLGNMYASPISYEGKIWLTSEALFQALRFEDEEIRELIRLEKSPMGAKMKAKGNKVSNLKVKEIEMEDPFAEVSQEEIEMESEAMSPVEKLKAKAGKKGKGGKPQMELF